VEKRAVHGEYVGSVRSLVRLPNVALNLDEIQQSIDALILTSIRSILPSAYFKLDSSARS
jgi:hypothetical protein